MIQFGADCTICPDCKEEYVQKIKEGCLEEKEPSGLQTFLIAVIERRKFLTSLTLAAIVFCLFFIATYSERATFKAKTGYPPAMLTISGLMLAFWVLVISLSVLVIAFFVRKWRRQK